MAPNKRKKKKKQQRPRTTKYKSPLGQLGPLLSHGKGFPPRKKGQFKLTPPHFNFPRSPSEPNGEIIDSRIFLIGLPPPTLPPPSRIANYLFFRSATESGPGDAKNEFAKKGSKELLATAATFFFFFEKDISRTGVM